MTVVTLVFLKPMKIKSLTFEFIFMWTTFVLYPQENRPVYPTRANKCFKPSSIQTPKLKSAQ